MELLEKIYSATDCGLDIIGYYYPEARECASNSKRKFKLRESERTPSASIYKSNGLWKVTDFGGDGKAVSPVDLAMEMEGKTFMETLLILADRHQVDNGYNPTINKPEIRKRAATDEESEGSFVYVKKEFTAEELAVLGPKVTADICAKYSFYSLAEYSKTNKKKDTGALETTTFRSSDKYPIFMRDCGDFQKIYKPCEPDKAYRFFYAGIKPKDFVNGLSELKKFHADYIRKNDEETQLPEAIICSGERDALNVAAMGSYPIWLNSETADFPPVAYYEIRKLAKVVYNIPDIDTTGIRKGKELALRYLDLSTIWLPDWLRTYKDRRGRARKDLLDYIELRPSSYDFNNLIKSGRTCQFWEYVETSKGTRLEINSSNLLNLIYCSGFGILSNKDTNVNKFVKVTENKVEEITGKELRKFLITFAHEKHLSIDIQNMILNSRRIGESLFDMMKTLDLNFKDYNRTEQCLFFENEIWRVTPEKTIVERWKDIDIQVWNHEVRPNKVRRNNPSFSIENRDGVWDINILNKQSKYFSYLINASRIFWREELEERASKLQDPEKYIQENRFSIAGDLLTPEERNEQKLHLVNKIFSIGYLLHRYKAPDRPWCVLAMDNFHGEVGEHNGGSGKSFCFQSLRYFLRMDTIDGQNKKITDNAHLYERIDEYTDMVLVDDLNKETNFSFFYNQITGVMNINPKNNRSFTLTFDKSPKFVITSNHTMRIESSSHRRLLYTVFSDYYHEKTDKNNYKQTRTISEDFGRNLFDDQHSPEDWNQDINFFADCLQFYLSTIGKLIKITPPMKTVIDRSDIAAMGENFHEWAVVYFGQESEHLDTFVVRNDAFYSFISETKVKMTMNAFSKRLGVFAQWAPWIECYQPKEFQNESGRIIRKNDENKAADMIYMRSCKQILIDHEKPF